MFPARLKHYYQRYPVLFTLGLILSIWLFERAWQLGHFLLSRQEPIAYVDTLLIKPSSIASEWKAVAIVKAANQITVSSSIMAPVIALNVAENQSVEKGQVIITLKHDDLSAQLASDQALLTQKQLYLTREQQLVKSHADSIEALNEAQRDRDVAAASVALDQAKLANAIISAPFSGVLGIWQVDMGQLVQPGTALVTLTQLTPSYLNFSLPAQAISQIKLGSDVRFQTTAYPHLIWSGKVEAIDPQLDADTKTLLLRARLNDNGKILLPGLYGTVTALSAAHVAILIPQIAINYDPNGDSVYVVKKGRAEIRMVRLGIHQQDRIEILSGLYVGDEVVVSGVEKCYPGEKIVVNNRG